jgi:aarF domain-containing kinase
VPTQYVELFATVQDDIPQWPYEEVEKLVRESLRANQGLEWDEVFVSMDETALGSASIGQCHKAVMKSPWESKYSGDKTVAVKIMHPDAETRFTNDFQVFRWLCRLALPGWKPILNELQTQMMTEFDYKVEAENLEEVRGNMLASPYASKVTVPQPLHELCSKNMLVMEMLKGKKFGDAIEERLSDAIGGNPEAAKDFLRQKRAALVMGETSDGDATDLIAHGRALLEQQGKTSLLSRLSMGYRLFGLHRHLHNSVQLMLDVHGHQIFVNRVFNGDCHPGNMMELSNGKIGLIDYGQTKRLSSEESLSIARVVSELGKSSVDDAKVAEAMRKLGFKTKFDKPNVLTKYAKLFFDSDDDAKAEGCVTPQLYLLKLSTMDPLITVPDAAVFTARMSFLFRGMGAMAGDQIHTSKYWSKHADKAIAAAL